MENVRRDYETFVPIVKPGGIVIFDDVGIYADTGEWVESIGAAIVRNPCGRERMAILSLPDANLGDD